MRENVLLLARAFELMKVSDQRADQLRRHARRLRVGHA
jgi:hypothetical protein